MRPLPLPPCGGSPPTEPFCSARRLERWRDDGAIVNLDELGLHASLFGLAVSAAAAVVVPVITSPRCCCGCGCLRSSRVSRPPPPPPRRRGGVRRCCDSQARPGCQSYWHVRRAPGTRD
eukprot:SAG25_NODE_642_length_6224_cov_2.486041_8_plen_119_part_00